MTDLSPRPCTHTMIAMAVVLLAGLAFGAFPLPTPQTADTPQTMRATTKLAHGR